MIKVGQKLIVFAYLVKQVKVNMSKKNLRAYFQKTRLLRPAFSN